MERLTRITSEEHSKVSSDAVGELTCGLEVVEFACGIPYLQKGERSANVGTGVDSHPLTQPLGVCVGITPFNFSAMVSMWVFPITLVTGNAFALKLLEEDPSLTLALARLLQKAGLPDGVLNTAQGDKESADMLLTDPHVQTMSFAGSMPIAEYIYQTASAHGKRCQALGGAKDHCILMLDADMDVTTNVIMGAAYGAAGERCMVLSIVLAVGDRTADKLCPRPEKQITTLHVRPGLDRAPKDEMGPFISSVRRNKMFDYIDSGKSRGANLCVDGRHFNVKDHEQGHLVEPTLFDNVTPEMTTYKEEIFGLVLSVMHVTDYDSAVELTNRHEYGNGTVISTRNGGCARRFCEEVQAGMVGVNVPILVPMALHSFSSWKRSIFGAPNVHGNDGVHFHTRMRTITVHWPEMLQDTGTAFSMPTLS